MSKKEECEIIQDLLPSYIDNILNEYSKKTVEQHLGTCKECQIKYKNMKENVGEKEIEIKKQIDYLKKIKRKTKVKIIGSLLGCVVIILLGIYLYNTILLHNIQNAWENLIKSDNFYVEEQLLNNDEGTTSVKIWNKGGVIKEEWGTYKKEDNQYHIQSVKYRTVGEKENIDIFFEPLKQASQYNYVLATKETEKANPSHSFFIKQDTDNIWGNFIYGMCAPVMMQVVGIDTKDYGKEYYKIKLGENEYWFDKETYLPIRAIEYGNQKEFYPGTEVVKANYDIVAYYKYQKDVVTEEDVQKPDMERLKEEGFSVVIDLTEPPSEEEYMNQLIIKSKES